MNSTKVRRRLPRDTQGRQLEEIHPVLAQMLYRREAENALRETVPLRAEISRTEMFALHDLILDLPRCERILEIGCAMGISSLVICAALEKRAEGGMHVILDPFQRSRWKDTGRRTLERAGVTSFDLRDEASEVALPRMMLDGERFDFIFQDGMHTFDHAMLEYHYLDRILRPEGLLVYDDVDIWGMNRFIRYGSLYPHWSIEEAIDRASHSVARRSIQWLQRLAGLPFKLLPRSLALDFGSDALLRSDHSLGLDASMIALRKRAQDDRSLGWNEKF